MKKYLVLLILLVVSLSSCEDFLDPRLSNQDTEDVLLQKPDQVRGLVYFAYRCIPKTNDFYGDDFLESATDNAVSNNVQGDISKMAEINGYLSPTNNPLNVWGNRYEEIMSINRFFTLVNKYDIEFVRDPREDSIVHRVTRGEGYFLKAYAHFDLLRRYAGLAIDPEDGQEKMMGIIIADKDITSDEFVQLPRSTYKESLDYIVACIDSAMVYLPEEWDKSDDRYLSESSNMGRPDHTVCNAFKSRLYLYAASPAFSVGLSPEERKALYAKSAEASMAVMAKTGFDYGDYVYYDGFYIKNPSKTFFNHITNTELIMRRVTGLANPVEDRELETRHMIPSRYGKGRCNPSQDLVDAFPMINGYPIDHPKSGYDPNNPYAKRDNRLYQTIFYNGVNAAFNDISVETFEGGKDNLNSGHLANVTNSTRTGYYLRKWMSNIVNLTPGNEVSDKHYATIFRQVEVLLNFAEAVFYMNDGNANAQYEGKTAKDAMKAIALRASDAMIPNTGYCEEVAGSSDEFEKFMKNERRIELCFEGGHRFYDVRRWGDELAVPVHGIKFANAADKKGTLTTVVEKLAYNNDNPYLPLPQSEIGNMPNLTQNKGW